MIQTISHIVSDYTLNAFPDTAMSADMGHDHERLAQAIHDGDADQAERLMDVHSNRVLSDLARIAPARIGERIQWF